MNDIVSIRKIRPLPCAEAGRGPGAALPCGEDFFLAGNEPSLTVMEFLTTEGTKEYQGIQSTSSSIRTHVAFQMRVCPCVPRVPSVVKILGRRVSYGVFSARRTEC